MEKTIVEKVEDWGLILEQLMADLPNKTTILALSGDLGVGKTTLVQQLAKILGIVEPITSPTFTIMKRYEIGEGNFKTLIHMDAYRLDSEAELAPLRFEELISTPNTLFCIEWAEKIKNSLPADTVWLKLEIDKEGQHTIQTVS